MKPSIQLSTVPRLPCRRAGGPWGAGADSSPRTARAPPRRAPDRFSSSWRSTHPLRVAQGDRPLGRLMRPRGLPDPPGGGLGSSEGGPGWVSTRFLAPFRPGGGGPGKETSRVLGPDFLSLRSHPFPGGPAGDVRLKQGNRYANSWKKTSQIKPFLNVDEMK